MTETPETLGRAPSAGGGEIVLLMRPGAGPGGTPAYELIIDGVFAMDTVQVSTELALASEAIGRLSGTGWHVVVGGLGLGYTLRELLADQRVTSVEVVELEPALVTWVRDGRVGPAAGLLDDPRVAVVVGDVREYLGHLPAQVADAVLLDVDNGPDFLVHQENSSLYDVAALTAAMRVLRPGGRLAVWSAAASPELEARLRAIADEVEVVTLPVRREGRSFDYLLYLAARAPGNGAIMES